jgi:peptide-methionine (S)-S-oxide reductase
MVFELPITHPSHNSSLTTSYHQAAMKFRDEIAPRYKDPIVVEINRASVWYPAEAYHQQYLSKGGQCSATGDMSAIRCYG